MAEHGQSLRATHLDEASAWQAYDAWEAGGGPGPSPGPIDAPTHGLRGYGLRVVTTDELPPGLAIASSPAYRDDWGKIKVVWVRNIH